MDSNNIKTALDAGAASVAFQKVGDLPFVIVPDGYKHVSLEKLLPYPLRKRGTVNLDDAKSFISYVEDHSTTDRSVIYLKATPSAGTFVCVLDGHKTDSDDAGWGEHRVIFAPQPTVEWLKWSGSDKVKMSQVKFAEFLEENLPQIVNPTGAQMVEIALELQAKTNVEFSSGLRLQNGNHSIKYEEVTEAKGKGDLEVPGEFEIGVVLFEGGTAYRITARLRFRIEQKQLFFWYELVRPHLVVKDAFQGIREEVEKGTGLTILNGSAPAAPSNS